MRRRLFAIMFGSPISITLHQTLHAATPSLRRRHRSFRVPGAPVAGRSFPGLASARCGSPPVPVPDPAVSAIASELSVALDFPPSRDRCPDPASAAWGASGPFIPRSMASINSPKHRDASIPPTPRRGLPPHCASSSRSPLLAACVGGTSQGACLAVPERVEFPATRPPPGDPGLPSLLPAGTPSPTAPPADASAPQSARILPAPTRRGLACPADTPSSSASGSRW